MIKKMKFTENNISEIILEFMKSKQLVIFVGAGISHPCPSLIPLADEMVRMISSSLFKVINHSDEYLENVIIPSFRFEMFIQVLNRRLGNQAFEPIYQYDKRKPNFIHYFLAELARLELVNCIITTNFDCLIEKAFYDAGVPFNTYCYPKIWTPDKTGNAKIIKLHGSLANKECGIDGTSIATTINRIASPFIPKIREDLKVLAEKKNFMYLGYSGRDEYDIYPVLYSANQQFSIWVDHTSEDVFIIKTKQEFEYSENSSDHIDKLLFKNGDGIRVNCPTKKLICDLDNHCSKHITGYSSIKLIAKEIYGGHNGSSFNLKEWASAIDCHTYAVFGDLLHFSQKHTEAQPYYEKYHSISQEKYYQLANKEHLYNLAFASRCVGLNCERLRKKDKALRYYNEALNCYQELEDNEQLSTILVDIAILYEQDNDLSKSREFCHRAIQILEKDDFDSPAIMSTAYLCCGNCYFRENKFEEAIEFYLKARNEYINAVNPPGKALIELNLAYSYMKLNQHQKAYKYAELAMYFFGTIKHPRHPDVISQSQLIEIFTINLLASKGRHNAVKYLKSVEMFKEMDVIEELIEFLDIKVTSTKNAIFEAITKS